MVNSAQVPTISEVLLLSSSWLLLQEVKAAVSMIINKVIPKKSKLFHKKMIYISLFPMESNIN